MTNIFVFLLTIVHLHFIILHYSKNEFICVDRIYSYPVLLPVIIIMQCKYLKESSSICPYFQINQIISILTEICFLMMTRLKSQFVNCQLHCTMHTNMM